MNVGHQICVPAWKRETWYEMKTSGSDVPTREADIQHGHPWVQEEDHQQADISQGETYQEFVEGGEMVVSDSWSS